jgi:hypothetical protein
VAEVIDAAARDVAGRRAYLEATEPSREINVAIRVEPVGPVGRDHQGTSPHGRALRVGLTAMLVMVFLTGSLVAYQRSESVLGVREALRTRRASPSAAT